MHVATKTLGLAGLLSTGILNNAVAATDATDTLVNVTVDPALISEVTQALPESVDVNQEFLNPNYNPNISFQEDAHVAVTFLDEGAGYRNSLGYFTFEDNTFDGYTFGDIDSNGSGSISISEIGNLEGVSTGLIFANASESGGGGSLNAGDTVGLGGTEVVNIDGTSFDMEGGLTFSEGTNMGFFLMQNAYQGSWGGNNYLNNNATTFYTLDFLNPENSSTATFGNAGEFSRHVAMMTSVAGENELILGFEDLVRPGGDNDFNDAVFRIRTDPVTAMFADVPTTETVISMQAAPLPELGRGLSGLFACAIGGLFLFRRRTDQT